MPITHIAKSALLPYAADNLFDLVNDITAYPQYMEGCVGAHIVHTQGDVIEARLDLARAGIEQSFVTRNRLMRPHSIVMELVEGPFRTLNGHWQFKALAPSACKVSLDLQFEIDGRLAKLAVGLLFASVANTLVDSLCKRAHQLHGGHLNLACLPQ